MDIEAVDGMEVSRVFQTLPDKFKMKAFLFTKKSVSFGGVFPSVHCTTCPNKIEKLRHKLFIFWDKKCDGTDRQPRTAFKQPLKFLEV